ncbi:MAG: leucine-rich repeat domain-containing protein [Treponema sp.]|jgi:Leucine-rich repeat (LRR) protein|nr:leucine-rich repeat domain-containing protein [Treponema sp.]
MPETAINQEDLDLHWMEEDAELGIPSEGIYCKNLDELSKYISDVKNTVVKINLDNQPALKQIPPVLGECIRLEKLDISHTEITEIPDFLFSLPNLRSLSCCCNRLSCPPSGFSKAKKLENLHIRINEGWAFPDEITALPELKNLNIDLYKNIALPESIGNLEKLETLTLSLKYKGGDCEPLPKSLSGHDALKKVSVSSFFNKEKTYDLDRTAEMLASCPKLESLLLSGLKIEGGHEALSKLAGLKELKLEHLHIDGNVFTMLPALSKLEKLIIWGSEFKITKMPDIFESLPKLRIFSFSGNFVRDLPPSLYSLKNLTELEIDSAGIAVIDKKIGELKNLKKFHFQDNVLETLPESIFTLPNLAILDIEDNLIVQKELMKINENLIHLHKKGQRVAFFYKGQGVNYKIKRLRSVNSTDETDIDTYYKYCLEAVSEDPHAIQYVEKDKLKNNQHYYAALCAAAVGKSCFALEYINIETLGHSSYFSVCMQAAKSSNIGHIFKRIRDDLLTDIEYTKVCIEAALHNNSADFLSQINIKRFSRADYERICWVSILHNPATISKVDNPSNELRKLAERQNR